VPEGDTIFRAARTLDRAISGKEVRRLAIASVRDRGPLRELPLAERVSVHGVEARGKHLLIELSDGRALHSHMGMTGSWHAYRPGEPWQRPERNARAVLETDDAVAVCFTPQTLEVLPTATESSTRLRALGPDLSRDDADVSEAVWRLRRLRPADCEIGVALLDQRISSGIGNVYKSETLHACRVDPFARISDLSDEEVADLFVTGSGLLRRNVDTVIRSTVPGGLAVYGRAGQPCRRCGTPIRSRRQGEHARTTYWCPSCQSPLAARRLPEGAVGTAET
jgi:endonuclease-8